MRRDRQSRFHSRENAMSFDIRDENDEFRKSPILDEKRRAGRESERPKVVW